MHPRLTARVEQTRPFPVLVWQFAEARLCISSGPLGGGIGTRNWVVNATVPLDYGRTDPDRHLTEIGAALELVGTGCGLLTAVDVTRHHLAADTGVHAAATVGLSHPTWAAAPDLHFRRELPSGARAGTFADYQTVEYRPLIDGDGHRVGTINIVVAVPVQLCAAALVNAVATATEAKVQALYESGVQATGTASDAVIVHCPTDGTPQAYGGPRSALGARIARAVHAAVLAGTRSWISDPPGQSSIRPR
ncbi:adenosylcobinamide amidohydrolase [Mycobacterium vicinigordonae]|uniref:Adenosylcobinamide amidohydrolase n=1 Tax=Mycobacterium vicinigordonae TaxID=1719132 RepID=A0A7D6E3S9_9MYCO|nr:adenosylcobinamide amidohydrolase [Mycobacterium vicinigordonae]